MIEEENTFTVAKLIPNAITMLALCCGLFSVRLSIIGNFHQAGVYIIFACIMDAFDGKVARKLNVSSEFGAQMDSLADFFNFGIAPGFFAYFWKMQYLDENLKLLAWLPVLLLAMGMAIRLARFNVDLDNEDPNSPLVKYFFKGCPAPMDAMLVLLPFAVEYRLGVNLYPILVVINTILIAFFAASRIPTVTPKKVKIKNKYKNIILLLYALLSIGCVLELWATFILFCVTYLLSIVVGWVIYFHFKNELNGK
jgi:CDP-diacylglycerol--serine O-phosphatidyltransferase